MTERITVELKLLGQQYKGELKDMESRTEQFGSGVLGMAAKNERAFNQVGRAATVGGAAVLAGVGLAVNAAKNFEKEMSGVAAVANATAPEMKALADAAIEAGQATAFSALEAAKAEAELVKAGVSVADVLGGALRGSLDLAAAGQLDLAEAAEISAQAMNIFNLEGKDVGHIADVLAAGANKSAADVGQLGQALRQGGLLAAQTGLTLEETVATLSAFSDEALVGSDAGTSLKTMLQRLTPQSDEAAQTMRDLGFSAFDASGEFIGMEGLARELTEAMGDMSTEQRNAAMQVLFGSDAVRGANVLMKLGAEGVREYTAAVDDQGAAGRMAGEQMDNLAGDLEELSGSIETALIKFGQQGTGVLRGLTQAATGAVNWFSDLPEPIQGAGFALSSLVGAVGVTQGGLLMLLPKIAATRHALETLGLRGDALKGKLGSLGSFMVGPWGLAIGGAVTAVTLFARAKANASAKVEELTAALEADSGALSDNTRQTVVNRLEREGLLKTADLLGISLEDLTDAALGDVAAQRRVNAVLDEQIGILKGAVDETGRYIPGMHESGEAAQDMQGKLSGLNRDLGAAQEEFSRKTRAMDEDAAASEDATGATGEHERALRDLGGQAGDTADDFDTLTEKIDAQVKALQASHDPAFAAADSLSSLTDAQHDLNEAIKEHGADSEEAAEAQQDLAKQALTTQEDMLVLAAAVRDGNVSIDVLRRRFESLEAQGMIPKGTADAVVGHLQDVIDKAGTTLDEFEAFGANAGAAFANGLQSQVTLARAAGFRVADAASGGVQAGLQIRSPSKVWFGFGKQTVAGFIDALEDEEPNVHAAVRDLFTSASSQVADILGSIRSSIGRGDAQGDVDAAQRSLDELTARQGALPRAISNARQALRDAVADAKVITPDEELDILRAKQTVTRAERELREARQEGTASATQMRILELELVDAQERLSETRRAARGPTDAVADAEKALKDLRAEQAEITGKVKAAQDDLSQAKLRAIDAERQLYEAGEQLIGQGPAAEELFKQIAANAGLSAGEVDKLIGRYRALRKEFEAGVGASVTNLHGPAAGGGGGGGAGGGSYTVKSGDSLSKIAAQVYGDAGRWRELYDRNRGVIGPNPNMIRPGQVLQYHSGGVVGRYPFGGTLRDLASQPLRSDEELGVFQHGETIVPRTGSSGLGRLTSGVLHAGGAGTVRVEVPVSVNGREIARATGNFGMDQLLAAVTSR